MVGQSRGLILLLLLILGVEVQAKLGRFRKGTGNNEHHADFTLDPQISINSITSLFNRGISEPSPPISKLTTAMQDSNSNHDIPVLTSLFIDYVDMIAHMKSPLENPLKIPQPFIFQLEHTRALERDRGLLGYVEELYKATRVS